MSVHPILFSCIAAIATLLLIGPKVISYLRNTGIVGIDQQKKNKPVLPTSGGVMVAIGIFIGVLLYVGLNVFLPLNNINLTLIFAGLLSILTISIIGFIDDIYVNRPWGTRNLTNGDDVLRIGLTQKTKALSVLPAAIPLMAINAGHSVLTLPFFGAIELGILYPLFLVPLGVLTVSNATNMLAGQNGLESSMAAIALTFLGVHALNVGATEAAAIAFISVAALLAFLKFNWAPAKILPGDSLTYLSGALIATVVIIGNIEKAGIIIFIPWIVEAFLKAKRKFRATSLGKLTKEGYLKPKNDRIESLTHVPMTLWNLKEHQIPYVFITVLIVLGVISFYV